MSQNLPPQGQPHPIMVIGELEDAEIRSYMKEEYPSQEIYSLINMIKGGNIMQIHKGVIGIRSILTHSISVKLVEEIMVQGILPILFYLIRQNDYPHLLKQTLQIFSFLVDHQICPYLVQRGLIHELLRLTQIESTKALYFVLISLAHILEHRSNFERQTFLYLNGNNILLELLKENHNRQEENRDIYMALETLCVYQPLAPYEAVKDILGYFMHCLETNKTEDFEAKTSMIKALVTRCKSNPELFEQIKNNVNTPVILHSYMKQTCFKYHEKERFKILLEIMRVFSKKNSPFIGKLIQLNFLDDAVETLSRVKKVNTRKMLYSVLKSISADDQHRKSLMNNEKMIEYLLRKLVIEDRQSVNYITKILRNFMSGEGLAAYAFFQEKKIVTLYLQIIQKSKVELLLPALETIDEILQFEEQMKNENKESSMNELSFNELREELLSYPESEKLFDTLRKYKHKKIAEVSNKIWLRK